MIDISSNEDSPINPTNKKPRPGEPDVIPDTEDEDGDGDIYADTAIKLEESALSAPEDED